MRQLGAALVVPFPEELGVGRMAVRRESGRSALAKLKRARYGRCNGAPLDRNIRPRAEALAGPVVRDAQGRRHPPGRLRARRRPFAADRALQGRSRHPRRGADHRGGGHGDGRRRLARRAALGAAHAIERRRQLHQHAVADSRLPLSDADARHDARRVGGVQSLAGADGLDRRAGAEALRHPCRQGRDAGGGGARGAERAAACVRRRSRRRGAAVAEADRPQGVGEA